MSKPTDAERRKVAENLRYIANYSRCDVYYAEQFRDILRDKIYPNYDYHGHDEMLERLADLIDPEGSDDE